MASVKGRRAKSKTKKKKTKSPARKRTKTTRKKQTKPVPIVVQDSPEIIDVTQSSPRPPRPHVHFDPKPPQVFPLPIVVEDSPPRPEPVIIPLEPIPAVHFPPQPAIFQRRKPHAPQPAPGSRSGGRRITAPGHFRPRPPHLKPTKLRPRPPIVAPPPPPEPRPIRPLTTVMIPVHNLNRQSCELAFHNHKTGKALGKGAYGTVYELCESKHNRQFKDPKCPFVLKVQSFEPKHDFVEQFQHEIKTQIIVNERLGITPAVYDAWYCRPTARRINAFIVMERMDGDLVHYLKQNARRLSNDFIHNLVNTIKSYTNQLHRVGIKHNDIADRNILYKRQPDGRLRFVLSDWGLSMYVFHRQRDRRDGRMKWFFDDMRIVPFAMNQTEKDRDDIRTLERQMRMIQSRGVYVPPMN